MDTVNKPTASLEEKSRMRTDAKRFARMETTERSKTELLRLYARDVSRLLNELEARQQPAKPNQVLSTKDIRTRSRITDNRPGNHQPS